MEDAGLPAPGGMSGRPAGWPDVALLGLAGAVAAALPVTGAALWAGARTGDGTRIIAGGFVAVGLLVAVPVLAVGRRGARRAWPGQPHAATAVVFAVSAAAMLALAWLLPFRPGVLSCLLYAVPALLVSAAALLRSRKAVVTAVAGLAVLFVLTFPVRALQQRVAAREWARTTGVPSRTVAQVVHFPGTTQERYVWDGTTLTAMFDFADGPGDAWMAAETVRAGYGNPCGPVLTADGDAAGSERPPCVQEAPGLWYRGTEDEAVGYVLQRSGVTVTVTGGLSSGANLSATAEAAAQRAALRRIALAAHTATDAELWPRARPAHATLLSVLLL